MNSAGEKKRINGLTLMHIQEESVLIIKQQLICFIPGKNVLRLKIQIFHATILMYIMIDIKIDFLNDYFLHILTLT